MSVTVAAVLVTAQLVDLPVLGDDRKLAIAGAVAAIVAVVSSVGS